MTFSVNALKKELEALPTKERTAREAQLLADYARHAAFGRPLAGAGLSRLYNVQGGMEEASLAGDADIVSITTEEAFAQAVNDSSKPLLLIRSGAKIAEAFMRRLLTQSTFVKTVFIAQ